MSVNYVLFYSFHLPINRQNTPRTTRFCKTFGKTKIRVIANKTARSDVESFYAKVEMSHSKQCMMRSL